MKKIKVRDKSGDDFEIEEVEEKVETKGAPDKEELSKDDIAALKQLAKKVNDILALLEDKIDEDDDMTDKDEEEVEIEVDENGEELDVDGILAREEKAEREEIVKDSKKITDSQSSVGSIEKKFDVRAENANETEIASAWDKFYASQL